VSGRHSTRKTAAADVAGLGQASPPGRRSGHRGVHALPPRAGITPTPRRFSFLLRPPAATGRRTGEKALSAFLQHLALAQSVSSRPLPRKHSHSRPQLQKGPAAVQALAIATATGSFDDSVCRRPPRPSSNACQPQLLLAASRRSHGCGPAGPGPPPARPKGANLARDPERTQRSSARESDLPHTRSHRPTAAATPLPAPQGETIPGRTGKAF